MKRKSSNSVCFSVLGEKNTYWYIFEVSKEGEDGGRIIVPCRCDCGCHCAKRFRHDTTSQGTPFLSPTKVLPKKDREDPGWTVVGNQLYRLGGTVCTEELEELLYSKEPTQTVRALDLTIKRGSDSNNNSPWQHKRPMLVHRSRPQTVVVGEKLYVLGGKLNDDDNKPWAEVYDPVDDIWEALPRPPKIPRHDKFFSTGLEDDNDREKGGSIIVLSLEDEILLEYHVANKCWNMSKLPGRTSMLPKRFDHDIRDQIPCGSAVAVGHMLYWFSSCTCRLYSLHRDTHDLYTSEIVVDVPSEYEEPPMLGHLGGDKFFLLHKNYDNSYYDDDDEEGCRSDSDNDQRQKTLLMHCLKFSVALVLRKKKMKISHESSQSFLIKNNRRFNGCVVM
ncbi:hypothetical protein Tsubulata_015501 [Turnera subulata]|uniref:Galactose oxidase/kelch repeat superfamily protein n=1 Tax=Turnera subulata TaxID=218843 RepID=A0A9Q0G7M2_9ROSI|nr:hypothetical protein Tsubulata_015501 [Turnera subulata]